MNEDTEFDAPIYDWLLQNKEAIIEGTAKYEGELVTEQTVLHQFTFVFSLLFFSWAKSTDYMVPCSANGHLKFTGYKYALLSFLLGWWSFPWGPFLTVPVIVSSLSGGRKRSAISLIQKLEHGWDMPSGASASEHRRDIIGFSDPALSALRQMRSEGGFSEALAVRVTPDGLPEVSVAFDYPVSDGGDWIGTFKEFEVLIDKRDELKFLGMIVDYDGQKFVANRSSGVTSANMR